MRRAAVAALGISAVVGCADLLGFKELQQADSGSPDVMQPDVDQPDTVVGCQHASWPGDPDSGSSASPVSYDLAVHHVHLTQTPDGGAADFGFDLDHACTTDLASASCQPAKPSELITDHAGGVDNESIDLINKLIGQQSSIQNALSDDAINGLIEGGNFTILIRIYGLRSDQNQTSQQGLSVALQTAPHIVTAPPVWDGTDRWQVAASDTALGLDGGSNYPAAKLVMGGWVNDGTLVATAEGPATLTIVLPAIGALTGVLPITLSQIVFTGKLSKRGDGQYDITDGLISGRWAATNALESIASLTYDGGALCSGANAFIYDFIQALACPKRDINAGGFDDDTHPCDAFSVVMEYDAVATTVANTPVPDPVSTTPCPDAGGC